MNKEQLDQVSMRTGLSVAACHNMLENGWSYVEELGGKYRWESPIAQLDNTNFYNPNKEKN